MASGIIELNNSGQTAAGGYLMGKIEWTGQPDTAGNLSSVTIRLYAKKASTTGTITTPTTGNWECALTVDGETFAQNVYAGITADWVLLMEKTISVAHDSDGSKSIPIAASVTAPDGTAYAGKVTQGSGTAVLDNIPRASTMTISGGEMGSPVTFVITSASAAFTHSLTYEFGGVSGTILSYQPAGVYGDWSPPLDLAAQIPNAASGTVTYKLYTWNGVGVSVGVKTYSATLSVPASEAPDVADGWAKATYYNIGTAAASIAAFVQGYSKAQVTFDASKITTKYGATVKRYKIVCGSVTDTESPYLTGVLTGTSATITCTVTDSRGYTATGTVSVTLYPYKKPALSDVALYRADEDGTANRAGLCIYAKATLTWSDIGGKNSCSMKGYYRLQSGSYPAAGTEMTSGVGILLTVAAAATSTYVAKITAVDSLGNTAVYEATIPTDSVAFHIREGGQGAAFGKYAEEDDLLDVAWSQRIRKNLTLDGAVTVGGGTFDSPAVYRQADAASGAVAAGETVTLTPTWNSCYLVFLWSHAAAAIQSVALVNTYAGTNSKVTALSVSTNHTITATDAKITLSGDTYRWNYLVVKL